MNIRRGSNCRSVLNAVVVGLACCATGTAAAQPADRIPAEKGPTLRRFELTYSGTVKDLPAGCTAAVWIPVPKTGQEQTVQEIERSLPAEAAEHTERDYANRMLYFESMPRPEGTLSFEVRYEVERREVLTQVEGRFVDMGEIADLTAKERRRDLAPDTKVPVAGKPLELLDGLALSDDPLQLGRTLYDRIDDHMTYKKEGTGWGLGDSLWACESGYGNCTDFHSLFISLARARRLPARFEIGFSLPAQRGEGEIPGYHCWAWFYADQHGWVPVDISEADKHPELKDYYYGNLTPDRVAFTSGRDLELMPAQSGPPLNFFIYPYVEVEGQVWPSEKIELNVTFKDLL